MSSTLNATPTKGEGYAKFEQHPFCKYSEDLIGRHQEQFLKPMAGRHEAPEETINDEASTGNVAHEIPASTGQADNGATAV